MTRDVEVKLQILRDLSLSLSLSTVVEESRRLFLSWTEWQSARLTTPVFTTPTASKSKSESAGERRYRAGVARRRSADVRTHACVVARSISRRPVFAGHQMDLWHLDLWHEQLASTHSDERRKSSQSIVFTLQFTADLLQSDQSGDATELSRARAIAWRSSAIPALSASRRVRSQRLHSTSWLDSFTTWRVCWTSLTHPLDWKSLSLSESSLALSSASADRGETSCVRDTVFMVHAG